MRNRGRTFKFTVILVMTALALTGFTTRRGGGSSHGHSGGGGGGCSSSHQDHDSSSSTSGSNHGSSSGYGDDDSYSSGSTSGGYNRRPHHRHTSTPSSSGTQRPEAKVKLVNCATSSAPYAVVEVTNSGRTAARFLVSVRFVDSGAITVTEQTKELRLAAKDKQTTRVPIGGEGLVDSVDHCEVDPYASPA